MPSFEPSNETLGDGCIFGGNPAARTRCIKPLVYSGSLDNYKHADLTPVIRREYDGLQVRDLLKADDQVIRDLAATSTFSTKHCLKSKREEKGK